MNQQIAQSAQRILAGDPLDRPAAQMLAAIDGDDLCDLFYWANRIRLRYVGAEVRFCAIVAGKMGACSEDCKFCAQSSHYATAVGGQTKLGAEDLLGCAARAAEAGAHNFGIVNSGRGPTRAELEGWLGPVMQRISAGGSVRLCADLGALTPATAAMLRELGVRRINHNLETSERFYPNIVSTHPYSERIRTLEIAKAAGLELCSGGIFGLGETWEDRLDMLFALREIGVDVVPINFLNPIPGTPLAELPRLRPMECLKIIAICRFILPRQELKVAGGREVCLRDLQSWMFFAGASSAIIGNYLATAGRSPEQDQQMVTDLGMQWRAHDGGGPASE